MTSATRQPARGRRSRLWRYRRLWFLVVVVGFTALAGLAWVITQVPLPTTAPQAQTTVLYDARGGQLARLHDVENRTVVPLDQVPDVVQKAVVSAEDHNFFVHRGIDPVGIVRALWFDMRGKGVRQGGSTITQQYVKTVYVGNAPTLWRKLREAALAIRLERELDKRQILERYLNTIYFGRGAYGIQAAAQAHFNLNVGQLGLREASYLAGIIRNPAAANLSADPVVATELRGTVLDAMVRDRVITVAQADEVKIQPLKSYVRPTADTGSSVTLGGVGAEYFVEDVKRQLEATYGRDRVLAGGLQVYTSLDPALQRMAFDSVYGLLNGRTDPAGALVSLDRDGRVVAMVGGRDWNTSNVNLAVGTDGGGGGRQGGSTFKPFVLAQALRQGFNLSSQFDGPAEIVLPKSDQGNDWVVKNYDDAAFGRISLQSATTNSVNTVYAQLVTAVGPQRVVQMAHSLGITSPLEPVPSIVLGSQNVSVLEMAGAYHTFATGGLHVTPRLITKVVLNGSVLLDDRPRSSRVLQPDEAATINTALREVVERGSGVRARLRTTVVRGKTGTSDRFTDAWFVGFTDRLTTAVWMGYPQGQTPMLGVHGVAKVNGGSLPAMVFQRFMTAATPGDANGPPLPPVASPPTIPRVEAPPVPEPPTEPSAQIAVVPGPVSNPGADQTKPGGGGARRSKAADRQKSSPAP